MPHNVEDVVGDIEQLKDDLHDNIERAGRSSMGGLLLEARENVLSDADWRGNLQKALTMDVDDQYSELEFNVHTQAEIAPYAPFVEYGTGNKRNRISLKAGSAIPPPPDEGTSVPPDYPYSSPTVKTEQGFRSFASNIIEWVKTKPVIPETDISQEGLGYKIAAEIIEEGTYAHPFLRPAWFQNELVVKSSMKTAVRRTFS